MGRTWVARGTTLRATAALLSLLGLAIACGACAGAPSPQSAVRTHATPAAASSTGELFSFPDSTGSPRQLADIPAGLAPFFEQCRLGDAALSRVAERFARRQSEGKPPLDVSEISFALRAEGSPYVWPRAWTLEGGELQSPAAVQRMRAWLDSWSDGGERRCGMALVVTGKRQVLAAVAVDALADLEPVPVSLRSGAWVDVSTRLLVPASEAKLIVLGPSGAPFAVPTSFDGARARARFHADRPGTFLIQLLANVAGGPRPVLEANFYADVSTPGAFFGDAAPGEPTVAPGANADPAAALLEMVNLARATEQSPALRRDAALDAVAAQHAQAMRRLQRIAHDAGDGDPQSRVSAATHDVLEAGENVAHALDITRAHRALWASPSHRENLLQPRFDRLGVGVAPDPDGSVWVCEVFADFAEQPAGQP